MQGSASLVEDFIYYIQHVRGFAAPTVRSYRYVLQSYMEFLGAVPLPELTIQQLDGYIADFGQKRHLQASSVNMVRCVLRSFFLYVDKYRGIRLLFDYSMIRQVKAPRPAINFVKPSEMRQIVERLKTRQDKLMYLTMFQAALRIGELVNLQAERIYEDEMMVRGKGNKDRLVPLDPRLAGMLKDYLREQKILMGPAFRYTDKDGIGRPYTVSGLRKRWQRQLGELYRKPHNARHGGATLLMQQGMDIRALQTYLGHSHIATTMLYTHVTDQHLKESFQKAWAGSNINTQKVLGGY